jgi:WD40 repeat protein
MNSLVRRNGLVCSLLILFAAGVLSCAHGHAPPDADSSEPGDSAPALTLQTGHTDAIRSIAFSPNGKLVVTASADRTARLWTSDGKLLRILTTKSSVNCAVFSRDNQFVVLASEDNVVQVWSVEGKLVHTSGNFGHSVEAVDVSPDGQTILVGSELTYGLGSVRLLTINGAATTPARSTTGLVSSVSFSPDGKYYAYGTWKPGHAVTVVEVATGAIVSTFDKHEKDVASVQFSADSLSVLSTSVDFTDQKRIYLTDLHGAIKQQWGPFSSEFAVLHPDSKQLVVTTRASGLQLYAAGGALRPIKTDMWGARVAMSPDGTQIALARQDGGVSFYDMEGRLLVAGIASRSSITSLAISESGDLIVAGHSNNYLSFWSRDGRLTRRLSLDGPVNGVAISPDGKQIAAAVFQRQGSSGPTLVLLTAEGTVTRKISGGYGSAVAYSADGKTIYAGTGLGQVEIYDSNGELKKKVLVNEEGRFITSIAAGAGGKVAATGFFDGIKTLNADGSGLSTISYSDDDRSKMITHMALSRDGLHVIEGANYMHLFKSTGEREASFAVQNVSAIAMSRDGQFIAAGTAGKGVKLWDMRLHDEAAEPTKTFPDDQIQVSALVFSPDEKYLLAGLYDDTIRVWNIANGQELSLATSGAEWLAYTQDGYFDASPNGGSLLGMTSGIESSAIDQFALRNNRPDLILGRLGLATPDRVEHYKALYLRRLRRAGVTEQSLNDRQPPRARIAQARLSGSSLQLSLQLSDDQALLKSFQVFVNDVPLFGAEGKPLAGHSTNQEETVQLTAGRNKVEVSCLNDRGVESYRALTLADAPVEQKRDLYFLGFGVSKYRNHALDLDYADKDARDLAALFQRMEGKTFNKVVAKVYANEQVTTESIKNAKSFVAAARPEDVFVLFIAGHGVHDSNAEATYYYLTHEADLQSLATTAAPFEEIEQLLQGVQPRQKLFLMDTCESGELDESRTLELVAAAGSAKVKARGIRISAGHPKTAAAPQARAFLAERDRYIYNDLQRRSGAIVFSASGGGELSYESEAIHNGVFTKAVLDALTSKSTDTDHDGMVSTDELRAQVAAKVAETTGGIQHPTVDRDNLFQKFGFPLLE